jgi:hypothetical protein
MSSISNSNLGETRLFRRLMVRGLMVWLAGFF